VGARILQENSEQVYNVKTVYLTSSVLCTAVFQLVNIVVVFTAFDANLVTMHRILALFVNKIAQTAPTT